MILGSGVAWRVVGFVVCSFFFLVRFVSFSLSISFIHKYISFFSLLHDHGVSDTSARKCSFALRRLIGYFKAKWKRMKKNLYILIIRIGIVQKFSSKLKHTLNNTIQDICRLLFFISKVLYI